MSEWQSYITSVCTVLSLVNPKFECSLIWTSNLKSTVLVLGVGLSGLCPPSKFNSRVFICHTHITACCIFCKVRLLSPLNSRISRNHSFLLCHKSCACVHLYWGGGILNMLMISELPLGLSALGDIYYCLLILYSAPSWLNHIVIQ